MNNKNILVKKYNSRNELKDILKNIPSSDCCVVVNNSPAIDQEVSKSPNMVRISVNQFAKMCQDRKNGLPMSLSEGVKENMGSNGR